LHRSTAHGETAPPVPKGYVLADKPQETIRELQELVIAYAKQETLDPIKGMGRYASWGIAGASLMGIGLLLAEIGLLRLLQDETYPHLTGNWSWVPYLIVVVVSVIVVVVVMLARGKRKKKRS
jgi:Putative Actinobacterial Holin-X, holin superfamily III